MIKSRPIGVSSLSIFFLFAALISGISASSLLWPESAFHFIWRINPQAKVEFMGMGVWAILLLYGVCLACSFSAFGLWQGHLWGHRLALLVFSVNLIGDAANVLFRHDLRSLIGIPIVAICIVYLLTKHVRSYFVMDAETKR